MVLKHEVRMLRNNLENHDKYVEKLRAEGSRLSYHYKELWSDYGTLLEEAQTVRSQVIALRSGSRVESTRG